MAKLLKPQRTLDLKVTFDLHVVLEESVLPQIEQSERDLRTTLHNLGKDQSLADLSPQQLEKALLEWFSSNLGVDVCHQDDSGKAPMVGLDRYNEEVVESVSMDGVCVEIHKGLGKENGREFAMTKTPYTEHEETLLKKTVISIKDIKYPPSLGLIRQGTKGTIVDFGATSGDPVIQWGDSFSAIAVLGSDVELFGEEE